MASEWDDEPRPRYPLPPLYAPDPDLIGYIERGQGGERRYRPAHRRRAHRLKRIAAVYRRLRRTHPRPVALHYARRIVAATDAEIRRRG